MENQHRKISGYRELTQKEIDLMNSIKAKGQELLETQAELEVYLHARYDQLIELTSVSAQPVAAAFLDAEPLRWAAIGKTDIQTGIMALVRAVAQPTVG